MRHHPAPMRFAKLLACCALLVCSVLGGGPVLHADGGDEADSRFVNHGIAAPGGRSGFRGITTAVDADGAPLIVVHLWSGGGFTDGHRSLLLINARTGESEQHDLPWTRGTGSFVSYVSNDRYFYTTVDSHFVAFDIHERRWFFTAEDLPGAMVVSFTQTPDGMLYFGMYPGTHVFRFDRESRELTLAAKVADEDWPQYPHLCSDDQGWIYVAIRHNRANLLALHPGTGDVRPLLSEEERDALGPLHGALVWRGENGRAYAQLRRQEGGVHWYELYEGQGHRSRRPRTARATAREQPRPDPYHFANGWRIQRISVPRGTATIFDPDEDRTWDIHFEYESVGGRIHSIIAGPDGRIHGTTNTPSCIFRFDPADDRMESWLLGAGEHINDQAVQGRMVYGGHYSSGSLLEYDPRREVHVASLTESENPRLLARDDQRLSFGRPRIVLAHPDGEHVMLGGQAARVAMGGGILVYNVASGQKRMLHGDDLVPEQGGVRAMTVLPGGDLLVGSTARAPTGGDRTREQDHAVLYTLSWPDLRRGEPIDAGAGREVRDLITAPDGRAFGIGESGSPVIVYDPQLGQVTHRISLAEYGMGGSGTQAARTTVIGDDGMLYILRTGGIVRMNPQTLEHELIARSPMPISAGIALLDGRLYFASETELWSFRLPQP